MEQSLKVNPWTYARAYPVVPLVWASLLCVSLLLCFVSWWFLIAVALAGVINRVYWDGVCERGMRGDTCAAVVVSSQPYLIAVYTDMTKGAGSFPAIKIDKVPRRGMTGGPPEVGDRLAVICTYAGFPDEPPERWVELFPYVSACMTNDWDEIDRLLASIPLEDWQALAGGLEQVPQPYQPGIYFLHESA